MLLSGGKLFYKIAQSSITDGRRYLLLHVRKQEKREQRQRANGTLKRVATRSHLARLSLFPSHQRRAAMALDFTGWGVRISSTGHYLMVTLRASLVTVNDQSDGDKTAGKLEFETDLAGILFPGPCFPLESGVSVSMHGLPHATNISQQRTRRVFLGLGR